MPTKPPKPSQQQPGVWLKVKLPKLLHKQLAKEAIEREKTIPATAIELLTNALK